VTFNILRISALLTVAFTAACGGSSSGNTGGAAGTTFPQAGQGGNNGFDGGAGPAVWPGQTGIDGGAWIPSQACWDRAAALVELLTPAQCFGQMTTVDSNGLSVSEATTALLGSVFSGGGSDPTSASTNQISNLIPDWLALISSYLDVAKGYSPHSGLLYGLDSVHGNSNVQDAVIFPHAIGIGASRSLALAEQVGRITAIEMLGVGANWAFTPTVAAAQDERWGRTYETFGEKNALSSPMGVAMIKGLQNGALGSPASVLACAKHYAGDGNTDGGKTAGDVTSLDEAAFRQVAVEPYRPAIEAGVGSIMISYSSFHGTKMTASKYWLTDVLKGELGFQGFLVSDWDAVSKLPGAWKEQVKTAFNAGLDMAMLSHISGAKTAAALASTLSELVDSGDLAVDRIKDAVRRILTVKCEMGLLDGDTTVDPTVTAAIGSAEHRAAARDAVRQSLVLLKNDGTLPLAKTLARIHVTGSGADSLAKQCGGWTLGWQGLGTSPGTGTTTGTTVLGAVKKLFAGTGTAVTSSTDGSGAEGASYAIVVVGETPYAEGQGDKTNPTLQASDFSAIAKVKAASVPFAVVLFSGRPLLLTDANGASAIDQANAFIAAWLPGTEGDGIADVLFGDYKPTGKLNFTWPASLAQIPIHDGDGQVPLFPYDYGLTYP
jgi:beta-glucosidase